MKPSKAISEKTLYYYLSNKDLNWVKNSGKHKDRTIIGSLSMKQLRGLATSFCHFIFLLFDRPIYNVLRTLDWIILEPFKRFYYKYA